MYRILSILVALCLICTFGCENTSVVDELIVDHAGLIRSWDEVSLERGRKAYSGHCSSCHGLDGTAKLRMARSFNKDKLRAGYDPYSMWRTLTFGYRQMLPQKNYTAAERYDIINYIRESIIKPNNPDQYWTITDTYLDSLPKGEIEVTPFKQGERTRDFGPVLTSQLKREVNRAITFFLNGNINLTYDLHRMRQAEVWSGFLNLSETQHMRYRGEGQPFPDGESLEGLQTYHWAFDESFAPAPDKAAPVWIDKGQSRSPMDSKLMMYKGHYLHGNKAALAFSIFDRSIMEMVDVAHDGDKVVLQHTIRIEPGTSMLRLCVGKIAGEAVMKGIIPFDSQQITLESHRQPAVESIIMSGLSQDGQMGDFTAASVVGQTEGFEWEMDEEGRFGLHIPPGEKPIQFKVLRLAGKNENDFRWFQNYAKHENEIQQRSAWNLRRFLPGGSQRWDMTNFLGGGPGRWEKTLFTWGRLNVQNMHYVPSEASAYQDTDGPKRRKGEAPSGDIKKVALPYDPPYVYDDIPLPEDNPWNAWMRPSALDCFDDGRIAVSTLGGDVWIVSGVDESLRTVRWRRFATGMFEPLGLKIIENKIYVTCRDGIIKLYDLNDDGEADFYETFYTDPDVSNGFHAFNFDLQTDSAGNLYYTKPGRYTDYPHPGAMMKISPDGKRSEVIARGFRVPNGMGIDAATDVIYVSGQEGNWVPAGKISVVPQNQDEMPWFGVSQTREKVKDTFVRPMLWLPRELDNSSAGQIVVHDSRWGPLDGKLIHTSFGKGWMYYIMEQTVNGVRQAAAVAFPFQFDAGLMRARVNPGDGQVYAVGLTGWDTEAVVRDGCLIRVRYTGEPAYLVIGCQVRSQGILLKFSFDLQKAAAENKNNYDISQWNYQWTSNYGSEQFSVKNPREEGVDVVEIAEAVLLEDGRSVLLKIPDIRPVDQMRIQLEVSARDNTVLQESIYLTINKVPNN